MNRLDRNVVIKQLQDSILENRILLAELCTSYDMSSKVTPDDNRWVWIRTISGDRHEAVWHPDKQAWYNFSGDQFLQQHVVRWWEKPVPMGDLVLAYETLIRDIDLEDDDEQTNN